jgi:DNA-binding LacI/PurR family transcriptional regulator
MDGWRAGLAAHRIDAPPPVPGGDWSAASGYAAGLVLGRSADVTAVFAANDHIALGLIRALSEMGRSVPRDVSLVGFDDIPEAAYFLPPLTTIRQEFGTCARLAVSMLIAEVKGGQSVGAPHRRKVPQLVVRSSTTASPAEVRAALG